MSAMDSLLKAIAYSTGGDRPTEPSPENSSFSSSSSSEVGDNRTGEQRVSPAVVGTPPLLATQVSIPTESDLLLNEPPKAELLFSATSSTAVVNPNGNGAKTGPEGKEERPSLSYKDLIIEAIETSTEKRLKLSEIYQASF